MLVYMNIFDCLRSVVSDLEIFIDLQKLNRNTRTSPPIGLLHVAYVGNFQMTIWNIKFLVQGESIKNIPHEYFANILSMIRNFFSKFYKLIIYPYLHLNSKF